MPKFKNDKTEMKQKRCFVIMPISDPSGYESGHFSRVYNHLIKPACEAAGFEPIRADAVQSTNYIVIDILSRILESEMVICDLSAKNPNVLYELGMRQAFDKKVVLMKDSRTDRIFDIQGIRTIDYDENLRVDRVGLDIENIKNTLIATETALESDVNSLVKILSITKASPVPPQTVSSEMSLVLSGLKEISARLTKLEDMTSNIDNQTSKNIQPSLSSFKLPDGEIIKLGERLYIYDGKATPELGDVIFIGPGNVVLRNSITGERKNINRTDGILKNATTIPF